MGGLNGVYCSLSVFETYARANIRLSTWQDIK
jgi:hypothetical protein